MTAKYTKGPKITDPIVAVHLILERHPIYWHDKCQNSGWLQNSQINMIAAAARKGILFYAIPKEKTDE